MQNPESFSTASTPLTDLFGQALAQHQAGRLDEAQVLYEQLLARDDGHVDALTSLGTLYLQQGRLQEGIELLGRSLAINPDQPNALVNRGNALKDLKRLDEALQSYERAITLEPEFAPAHYNRGNALNDLGRRDEALASYERAIALKPDYVQAYYNRGNTLRDLKRLEEAVMSYDRAIALRPDFAEAYYNRGCTLNERNRLTEALTDCERAIALRPNFAGAHFNRGNALQGLKRLEEAVASYDRAIALRPDFVDAHYNRGNALQELKRLDEALLSYHQAIALNPDFAEAFNNRGNAFKDLKRLDEALADYDRAIALQPDYAEAYNNRGNALNNLKRPEEALASYDRAIALKPDYAEAYNNRGNALNKLKRPEEALENYDRAIALRPDYADAYYNRGIALQELKRLDEALASYDRAIALKPDYVEAYNNRGIALADLKCLDEALAYLDRTVTLKPGYAEAYNNRGNTLLALKRYDEAAASYAKALAISPELAYVPGSWLHSNMNCCDWKDFDLAWASVADSADRGERTSTPFFFLATPSRPSVQQQCARTYVRDKYPASPAPLWHGERYVHDRIRIGYFSADFRNHPVAHLITHLIECHDRARFEITGFSLGPPANDPCRQRLERTFDRFLEVGTRTDREIATLTRELGIDIAIDLNGHTEDGRSGVFALRPAPVQVNYLGYPGTLGADYIDYLIADHTLIPAEHQPYYDEKIVYLPHSYQVNDSTKVISDRSFSRAELGLPEHGFVFCCFNNTYKITPDLFAIWMHLLHRVEGSVLWLSQGNPTAAANLRLEAGKRGIAPQRLVFASRMESLADHLARHRQADLFLDTFYYNAHTTASDALWAGLPVLTCLGETFAGRVAASLLKAVGLPELITRSHAEYETLALELATNPERLAAIRRKLSLDRTTQPLFDTARFTRHIEAAYTKMYERCHAGLPPQHIVVSP